MIDTATTGIYPYCHPRALHELLPSPDMRRMCVVALAHRVHPDWPLILIGNRDEFHARAAAPLHEWDDGSGIVAGRDLQAGGTWLGVPRPRGRPVVVRSEESRVGQGCVRTCRCWGSQYP